MFARRTRYARDFRSAHHAGPPRSCREASRGKVAAARFVDGRGARGDRRRKRRCARSPRPTRRSTTEALMGERVTVYESTTKAGPGASSRPTAMSAGCRRGAAARRARRRRTGSGAAHARVSRAVDQAAAGRGAAARRRLAVTRERGAALRCHRSAFVPARHLAPLAHRETDFVAVAERFLGTPYLWGGKTSLGLDCSGLVQVALTAGGIACPRDSDMQERALGHRRSTDSRAARAATWCSGRAMWRSCSTRHAPPRQRVTTWRSRSSRSPRRSRASGGGKRADRATSVKRHSIAAPRSTTLLSGSPRSSVAICSAT